MKKFANAILTLLILTAFAVIPVASLGNHIVADCNNKGHFTLVGETYLCRPIGKLTEGVKR